MANLVVQVRPKWTGQLRFVGVLSPIAFKKGTRCFQAIGGAAELTPKGREFFKSNFGAKEFDGNYSRFLVPNECVDPVFSVFERGDGDLYEVCPRRELVEELTNQSVDNLPPVLTWPELGAIDTRFLRVCSQPLTSRGNGASLRERKDIPTRRFFRLFEMVTTKGVLNKMANSEKIAFLSLEELATTRGGTKKGFTKNGIELSDNLGFGIK